MLSILSLIQLLGALGLASSLVYYAICLWSASRFLSEGRLTHRSSEPQPESVRVRPPVSILKPLKGTDPEMYESFRSHCRQDYPVYEIIFGVSDPNDSAIDTVCALQREFPERRIVLVVCSEILGANVKVSNLAQMLPKAQHEFIIVNDSDIRVEPGYLRDVTESLSDPQVGLVTCLYRAVASPTLGSRLEALGISTDFCPGVLVARQLEGIRFGLGSTLAFRKADLERLGGFAPIVDYLADDYELGKRIAGSGLRVELSHTVVETYLAPYTLLDFFRHQLRWGRGVRDARAGGYLGLVSTFGILWALVAVIVYHAAGWTWFAMAAIFFMRLCVAWKVGWKVLHDRRVFIDAWLIPLRDLVAVAVWIATLGGSDVTWRGERFRLRNGRLSRIPPE